MRREKLTLDEALQPLATDFSTALEELGEPSPEHSEPLPEVSDLLPDFSESVSDNPEPTPLED
jgi:hypothetical protein